uniref:RING-type domain-containing protein n=1 Tax=Pseudictyota dubia TaxID=2749911 RepID=A0A7R9Z1W9_9STRA|mmetsp:Transcript_18462/g.34249  ORF Transcript_18462/g.34249 Transcript_18462/m.34249 type:complete len:279 (+) Transcript_18462:169-1005(+)
MSVHPSSSSSVCVRLVCPICRAPHEGIPVARNEKLVSQNIVTKVFIQGGKCPICDEECSPLLALRCGHCFCGEDLQRLIKQEAENARQRQGRPLYAQAARAPTRRVVRAVRPPPSSNASLAPSGHAFPPRSGPTAVPPSTSPTPASGVTSAYFSPAAPSQAFSPGMAFDTPARPSSDASNISQPNLMASPTQFATSTYAAAGTIPSDPQQAQRLEAPKRQRLDRQPNFSVGSSDGFSTGNGTRRAEYDGQGDDRRKRQRGGVSMHSVRVPWAPTLRYT